MKFNFSEIGNSIVTVTKKYSPEILLGVGIVGTVAGTIVACKATTKAQEIVEETKKSLEDIKEAEKLSKENKDVDYTEKDKRQDLFSVYTNMTWKYIKLYAPAFIIEAVSISCLIGSNNILKSRNIALAASVTALEKGFKRYRKNVISRFGKEIDKELKVGKVTKEFEKETVDKKGNTKTTKEKVDVVTYDGHSEYDRFFDEYCKGWTKDPEYNLNFLIQQEKHANRILKHRKHLFLNEVYDMLGIPRTKAGQVVGWLYDNPDGDNYVDFGIYNCNRENCRDFVNGYEKSILLSFNVDGDIIDQL